jgi:hypothetical protein
MSGAGKHIEVTDRTASPLPVNNIIQQLKRK